TCRQLEQSCPNGYVMMGYWAGGYPRCTSTDIDLKTYVYNYHFPHKLDQRYQYVAPGADCFITRGPWPWLQPQYTYYSGNQWTSLITSYSGFYIEGYHDPGGDAGITIT